MIISYSSQYFKNALTIICIVPLMYIMVYRITVLPPIHPVAHFSKAVRINLCLYINNLQHMCIIDAVTQGGKPGGGGRFLCLPLPSAPFLGCCWCCCLWDAAWALLPYHTFFSLPLPVCIPPPLCFALLAPPRTLFSLPQLFLPISPVTHRAGRLF